jgi:hypothetical protein
MRTSDKGPIHEAISRRLRRLGAMPVDTSALDRAISAQIPLPRHKIIFTRWRVSFLGAAAALLIAAAILLPLLEPGANRASAKDLSDLYANLLKTQASIPRNTTANQRNFPGGMLKMRIPGQNRAGRKGMCGMRQMGRMCLPCQNQVIACCQRSLHHQMLNCVLIRDGKQIVAVVTARADAIGCPRGPVKEYAGERLIVRRLPHLNMVIKVARRRWMCLLGRESMRRLITLAGAIRSAPATRGL